MARRRSRFLERPEGQRWRILELYLMAQDAGKLPSEALRLNPSHRAVCYEFDQAVRMVGNYLMGQINDGQSVGSVLADDVILDDGRLARGATGEAIASLSDLAELDFA